MKSKAKGQQGDMSANYLTMLTKMDKLPIHTDMDTLNIYCEYLLNDSSKYINHANLTNLYDYINRMDTKLMYGNDAKMARYEFVRLYLEARVDKGITNRKMVLRYVLDNVENKYAKIIQREIIDSIDQDTLKKRDIEFISDMIFAQLNVIFLHSYKKPLSRLIEDLETGEFGKNPIDCNNAIQLFQSLLTKLTTAQRRSKQDNRFNLTDSRHFTAIMNEFIERALSDNNFWPTGMQGLNNMLGGGVEDARIYNFIGATGGFKSGLMLNLMKQIKLCNRGHAHKDPGKRPTILFLSQENNIWETILRIFAIFGTTRNIKEFKDNPNRIMEILAEGGFRLVNDELDIDIEFRYYGNMDIGVPDIRGIIEELDNQDREVIGIIQDYIERLRPPMLTVDRRSQLEDVSNQLHDLAIELDLWIITGSQFNREGVGTIEEARAAGRQDIGKRVGSRNVSESFGMLKNFDVNIAIIVEYDAKEERFWLAFRRFKFRGDDTDRLDYFCQPFVGRNSKIQLEMDYDSDTPVYRKSMIEDITANMIDEATNVAEHTRRVRTIQEATTDVISLESETIDPNLIDSINFYQDVQKDMERSALKSDGSYRDNEGFFILSPTAIGMLALNEIRARKSK